MAKILIVDDNEGVLKLASAVLKARDHAVVACLDPRDGLEHLQKEHFDLVMTDILMPGGVNGFDFVRTIRGQAGFENLPVIFLTGLRDKRDIEKAVMAGGDDYIIKPIDPDILTSKVDSLLKKKPVRGEGFVQVSLKEPASWDVSTEILQVSELGLTLWSMLPAPVGAKLKIQSPFFEKIEISPPWLRVASCQPVTGEENKFHLELHFVGVGEADLSRIRLWIRSALKR